MDAKKSYFLGLIFLFNVLQINASKFVATSSGPWNKGATYGLSCTSGCIEGKDYPGPSDILVIKEGVNVVIPSNFVATCKQLIIGDGSGISNGEGITQLRVGERDGGATLNIKENLNFKVGKSKFCILNFRNSSSVANIYGDVSFDQTTTGDRIIMTMGGVLNLYGNMSKGGKFRGGSSKGAVNFSASNAPQVIPIVDRDYIYHDIICNTMDTLGLVPGGNINVDNVKGSIIIQSGYFDNGGFSIEGTISNNFVMTKGSSFKVRKGTQLPKGFKHQIDKKAKIVFEEEEQ